MADAELSIEGSFWLASLPISGPQTPLGAVSKMIQMQHGAQRLAVCLIGAVEPVRDFCLIQAGNHDCGDRTGRSVPSTAVRGIVKR